MKKIELSEITFIGEDLHRPGSVIATARGELFVSDHECSVRELGKPKQKLQGVPDGFLTDGIALTRQREFLVANLGTACGGVCFVTIDAKGRTWISMSTRKVPRELAFNADTADGRCRAWRRSRPGPRSRTGWPR